MGTNLEQEDGKEKEDNGGEQKNTNEEDNDLVQGDPVEMGSSLDKMS